MATSTNVKCVQITIWLGNTQEVRVIADERYSGRNPCLDEMNYSRKDFYDEPAIKRLVNQLFRDLKAALQNGESSISVSVEGNEIIPNL